MSFHSGRTSRRSFLKNITVTTAGGIILPNFIRAAESAPSLRKVNVACIGVNGKGASDAQFASIGNNVVAICDVDSKSLAKAAMKYPKAQQFTDFRKMLDTVKEIEAVTVTTPDHAHYPAAMHAIALGKHVCVQKPLTNTLWEADQLHKAAKKKGIITQMGNQGHTYEGNRLVKEWIGSGAIGTVKEAHVWTNRPIWPQGKEVSWKAGTPPEELNWELWQAATVDHPYSQDVHPFKWRGFLEYGAGALGDMGCHIMDAFFFAMDLGLPDLVEAKPEDLTDIAWPRGATVKYSWKNVPKHGEVALYWYEGHNEDGTAKTPPVPKEMGDAKLGKGGFIIVGTDGVISNEADQAKELKLHPEAKSKDILAHPPAPIYPRSPNPMQPQQEWITAIREGKQFSFMSGFDYSVPLTELCLLGALAMRCGRPIEWDAAKLEVKGMPEAAKYIKREYRKGWEYSADKI